MIKYKMYKILRFFHLISKDKFRKRTAKYTKDYKAIATSKLFDKKWYLEQNPDVKDSRTDPITHYLKYGWIEGRNPSKKFDGKQYLDMYSDVAESGINPLIHYITCGKKEGRIIYNCISKKPENELKMKKHIVAKKGTAPNDRVIYTCITGGYDSVQIHYYVDKNWDYVIFTDNENLLSKKTIEHWSVRPLKYNKMDNVRNARWHKTHPHYLFPEYKYSVWIDGNVNICGPFFFKRVKELIAKCKILSIPPHPLRNCIYKEAEEVKRVRKDYPEIINAQVSRLREKGFPENVGLNETNIIFRQHNDDKCKEIMNEWWRWIQKYSRRDQLSFNYSLWKSGYKMQNFCTKKDVRYSPENFFLSHDKSHNGKVEISSFVDTAKTISVIIPIYNALEDTQNLFKSISKSKLSKDVEIILVNDCSKEETASFLRDYVKNRKKWQLLENEKNLGFVKTCNRGMKQAKGDIIVLLNSDTMIPKRWETRILQCFNSDPAIGLASPIASSSGLWDMPFIEGFSFEQMDKHVEKVSETKYPMLLCPEGFCIAIRKEVLDTVGYLDEIYGRGYCEETDLDLRALNAGWKLVLIDNLFVFHKRHASFGTKAKEKQLAKNKKILWGKWIKLYNKYKKSNPPSDVVKNIKKLVYIDYNREMLCAIGGGVQANAAVTLKNGFSMEQSILERNIEIKEIQIKFGTFNKVNVGILTLCLYENDKVVQQWLLQTEKLANNAYHPFTLEKILQLNPENKYILKMSFQSANDAVAVWSNKDTENSEFKKNDETCKGRICYRFVYLK